MVKGSLPLQVPWGNVTRLEETKLEKKQHRLYMKTCQHAKLTFIIKLPPGSWNIWGFNGFDYMSVRHPTNTVCTVLTNLQQKCIFKKGTSNSRAIWQKRSNQKMLNSFDGQCTFKTVPVARQWGQEIDFVPPLHLNYSPVCEGIDQSKPER